jgi:hypothetical protein
MVFWSKSYNKTLSFDSSDEEILVLVWNYWTRLLTFDTPNGFTQLSIWQWEQWRVCDGWKWEVRSKWDIKKHVDKIDSAWPNGKNYQLAGEITLNIGVTHVVSKVNIYNQNLFTLQIQS